jgi:hypothetical protein
LRNLDIRGGFHDFDSAWHFPTTPGIWANAADTDNHAFFYRQHQKFDLAYWSEARYWMRKILFGGAEGVAVRTKIARDHDIATFRDDQDCAFLVSAGSWLKDTTWSPRTVAEKLELPASYFEKARAGKNFAIRHEVPAAFLEE